MAGDRGAGARENRGGTGTGDGRGKGRKRDLYDGGKLEKNSKTLASPADILRRVSRCLRGRLQKGKLSLFVTAYHPVKETNPTTFLDFHLMSPRLKPNFYMEEKAKDENLENYKTVIP